MSIVVTIIKHHELIIIIVIMSTIIIIILVIMFYHNYLQHGFFFQVEARRKKELEAEEKKLKELEEIRAQVAVLLSSHFFLRCHDRIVLTRFITLWNDPRSNLYFINIFTLFEQRYNIDIYYSSSTVPSCCPHGFRSVKGLLWGAEPRFELGPALQQGDALLFEPRRTQKPRSTLDLHQHF